MLLSQRRRPHNDLFAGSCLAGFLLIAGSAPAHSHELPDRAPGSNTVLQTQLALADGLEVIVSDVVIPPSSAVPRHCHPGQEILVLVEGTAVHVELGKPDLPLVPGEAYAIPAGAIHAPRAGPDGARAIVFRVHVAGQPERVAVPEGVDNSACLAAQPAEHTH